MVQYRTCTLKLQLSLHYLFNDKACEYSKLSIDIGEGNRYNTACPLDTYNYPCNFFLHIMTLVPFDDVINLAKLSKIFIRPSHGEYDTFMIAVLMSNKKKLLFNCCATTVLRHSYFANIFLSVKFSS